MTNEENAVKNIFRRYIAEELKSPEVREAKETFIREHFNQPQVLIFRPVVLVPVLSLALVFVLVFQMQKPVVKPTVQLPEAVSVQKPILETIPAIPAKSEVKVREAFSEVGATMVYQKSYQDAPITIIWVFTPLEVVSKPASPLTGFTGRTNQ